MVSVNKGKNAKKLAKTEETNNKGRRRAARGKHCLWTESAMLAAIAAVRENGMSQRAACKTFQVPRSTLQVRLTGKTEIGSRPGRPTIMSSDQEEKLADFACNRAAMGIGFGRQQLLKYAEAYAKKHSIVFKNGRPSIRWWYGMKRRHLKITLRRPEGTAAVRHQCMDPTKVAKYFSVLKMVLDDNQLNSKPHTIWNMDETGVQLDHKPGRIIATKGSKYLHSRTSGNRETITVIGAINAGGGYIPPHVIVKGKTTRSLFSFQMETAPDGTTWSVSDSGWTKQGIALLWFNAAFLPNIGPDRPQLLIVDGHDSHNFVELLETAAENGIHIIELPAHTSNWLQPCDRTVFGPFKNAYRKACEDLMTQFPGTLVSRASFCGLLKKAWEEALSASNIVSGFRACGIHPFNPDSVPSEAYLPNCMYSVKQLIESEVSLRDSSSQNSASTPKNDGSSTSDSPRQTLSSSFQGACDDSSAPVVIDNSTTQNVFNISDFTSMDPEVVAKACATASPVKVLRLLESTLTQQQLGCFQYLYEKKYSLNQDETYKTWQKLKSLAEEQDEDHQAPSVEEIMDLNLSVGTLPSFSESLTGDFNIDDSFADLLLSVISTEQKGTDTSTSLEIPNSNLCQCSTENNILCSCSTNKQVCNVLLAENQTAINTLSLDETPCSSNIDAREIKKQNSVDSNSAVKSIALNPTTSSDIAVILGSQSHVDDEERFAHPSLSDHPSSSISARVNSVEGKQFPFKNRSYPGDVDSDILPYPAITTRGKKTNLKQKFFLITSTESRDLKLKEQHAKVERQRIKEEKAHNKQQQVKKVKKVIEKQPRGKKPNTLKGKEKPMPSQKTNKKTNKACKTQGTTDSLIPCDICQVRFCDDKTGRKWIECQGCQTWFHNACQGLDENGPEHFLCISCDA